MLFLIGTITLHMGHSFVRVNGPRQVYIYNLLVNFVFHSGLNLLNAAVGERANSSIEII